MQSILTLLRPSSDLVLEVKRLNRVRLAGSFVMIPILLLLALFTAQSAGSETLERSLGTLALAAGVGLRLWALGNIDGRKKNMLVTWGAYNHVRHPLYLGSFLILLGFCILAGSWSATILAGLVFLALYLPVIRAEERLLASSFAAAWESYCRHSWAFLPRLWGHGKQGEQQESMKMPFRLRRPVREIGVLALLFFGVLGAAELLRLLRRSLELPQWFV